MVSGRAAARCRPRAGNGTAELQEFACDTRPVAGLPVRAPAPPRAGHIDPLVVYAFNLGRLGRQGAVGRFIRVEKTIGRAVPIQLQRRSGKGAAVGGARGKTAPADEATLEFLLFLGAAHRARPSLVLTYRRHGRLLGGVPARR